MKEQFKKGFIYTSIGKYGNLLITLVINSILSRILTPRDYGVVAIVMVFITFFQLLSSMGIGPAIVQSDDLDDKDISSLLNYSLIFSFILSILFGLSGKMISNLYQQEIYIKLCWVLSISIFFLSGIVVPNAILQKSKKFKELNLIMLISSLIGGCIGVFLAINNFGVYALIGSTIANSMISFLLVLKFSRIKYCRVFSLSPLKKIFIFAKNQFMFNLINYFSRNADNVLIGKYLGVEELGTYSKAYQLLMYPNNIFGGIINPVLQPVLRDYGDETEVVKDVFFKIVHIMAIIGIPLSFFLSISAKEVIFFIYGDQWIESVLPFQILALSIWVQMVTSTTGSIFQVRNRTDLLLSTGIVSSIFIVSSIILGIFIGNITAVSILLCISFFVGGIYTMYMLITNVLFGEFIDIVNILFMPVVVGLISIIGIMCYEKVFPNFNLGIFFNLIIKGILFIIFFVVACVVTKEYKFLVNVFGKSK